MSQPMKRYCCNDREAMELEEGYPSQVTRWVKAADVGAVEAELKEALAKLNTPEIIDFAKAVNLEAAHQRERWGTDHDEGKTDADWFWLVGYLAGKALHIPEKRLHHLITAAAALANWHLYTLGKTNMRPGIASPEAALQPSRGEQG